MVPRAHLLRAAESHDTMDVNLILGLLLGALAAGAGVYFWLKGAGEAKGRLLADEAAAKAKAEALKDAEKLTKEAEARRSEAEAMKLDAERARGEAEAMKQKAVLEADATRQKATLEAEAAKQKIELELRSARQKAELDAKDLAIRARQEAEAALDHKRVEVTRAEQRIEQKESTLDKKSAMYDQRENDLMKRENKARELEKQVQSEEERYQVLVKQAKERLEHAAQLSSEEAKQEVINGIVQEANREAAKQVKRVEEEANEEAANRAKRIVGIAIQRYAGDYTCDRTVTTVHLPSDEMKGRIIGREGRNIRALEAATGIDIIIDDTPEAIILSGYNPVRREVARRAIDELLKDGRIHPSRIEEVVQKHTVEVDASMKEWGEKAMFELGLTGIHPEIVKLMGSLRYRTSYTQNQWQHSIEVGFIVGAMAAEMKLNVKEARRAGFLHDLGKAVSHEVEGGHAVIGADIAKKFGESDRIVHAIRAHHDDEKPTTVLAHLVAAGDAISGARPGARSENLDSYVKRLEELEKISLSFAGVERAFAVQAGREMRVIVDNAKVSDEAAVMMSRDIARKIEADLTYPGQIRVTVIRETRAVDIAR
jgi:ribonuclease Y